MEVVIGWFIWVAIGAIVVYFVHKYSGADFATDSELVLVMAFWPLTIIIFLVYKLLGK